jgi:hypothetical protein
MVRAGKEKIMSALPKAVQADQGRIDIDHVHIHLGQGAQAFEALHDVSIKIATGRICLHSRSVRLRKIDIARRACGSSAG